MADVFDKTTVRLRGQRATDQPPQLEGPAEETPKGRRKGG
jgi:hypothetical protein